MSAKLLFTDIRSDIKNLYKASHFIFDPPLAFACVLLNPSIECIPQDSGDTHMARRQEKKLSALGVKALVKPGFHSDGAGLYFRIEGGRRLWVFRYKRGGVSRWLSLGPDRDVTLAQAREAALGCRRQLREGVDPLEARQATKAAVAEAAGRTFEAVADLYIAAHKAGWRNEKHGAQWLATLKAYAYPIIQQKPVQAVTVAHVLEILEPIWRDKSETASRIRGRIEAVLDYATARHWRTGENPARWKGHLDNLLPARAKMAKVKHHAALPWVEMPGLMARLTESKGTAALCLRFLIFTSARSGEARGARWNEIDMSGKTWTLEGARMKAKLTHRVPLPQPALEILVEMAKLDHEPEGLVFPGGRAGKQLSDVAVKKALAKAGGGAVTVHGMRSTFRDWAAERTGFAREIAEAALAHTNRDKVEAAYLRGDHFEKRRRLMADWAMYLTRPMETAGATPIRQAMA